METKPETLVVKANVVEHIRSYGDFYTHLQVLEIMKDDLGIKTQRQCPYEVIIPINPSKIYQFLQLGESYVLAMSLKEEKGEIGGFYKNKGIRINEDLIIQKRIGSLCS